MKAIVYEGIKQVKVAKVDDPIIQQPDDFILKVTSTAICGVSATIQTQMVRLVEYLVTVKLIEDMTEDRPNILGSLTQMWDLQ